MTDIVYDELANFATKTISPANSVTELIERDDALRPIQVRISDGTRVIDGRATYNHAGQAVDIEKRARFAVAASNAEVLTRRVHLDYNIAGAIDAVTTSDRTTMRTEYDDAGRPVALVDPKGNRISSRFDSEGRLVAVLTKDSQGLVLNGMLQLWDEHSNLLARFSPAGLSSAHTATTVEGASVRINGNGQASAALASGGNLDVLEADDSLRHISIAGNGMLFRNGDGQVYMIERDDFGRIVRERAPDEGLLSYRYSDRLFEKTQLSTDGKQSVHETQQFSGNGRLEKRTLAGCAETYRYEGNVVTGVIGCGNAHTYSRDAFGQIVKHQQIISKVGGDGIITFTSNYAYDANTGRMTERRLPDGQRLAYRYDPIDGKPQSVSRDADWLAWIDFRLGQTLARALRSVLPGSLTTSEVMSAQWQPFGRVATLAAHNGVVARSKFDNAGRIIALDVGQEKQAPIEALRYRYDGAGDMVAVTRNDQQQRYGYDAMHRLVGESALTPQAALAQAKASGDAGAGNRALLQHNLARQTGIAPTVRRANIDTQDTWDAFGRQQVRGKQRLSYDDAHRLVAVAQDGKLIARYRYDALGNRVAKTVGAHTTYFLYDSAHQLVGEADKNGHLHTQYLYADHKPYAVLRGASGGQARKLFAIHADLRGLPLAVTGDDGAVVWRGQFDAFGNAQMGASTAPAIAVAEQKFSLISPATAADVPDFVMNLRFAGQYADRETGLYFNVHRYYDPVARRYITADPIGLAGGENNYAYVNGNPLGKTDPLGLFAVPAGAFLGNDNIFEDRRFPLSDGGHGDILRIAFAQYTREAGTVRFSQDIINQFVLNNYHSDANGPGCMDFIPNGSIQGGGQCAERNHFDNPNKGPMFSTMPDTTDPSKPMIKLPNYTDGEGDNFIQDALKQVNDNRFGYGYVHSVNGHSGISGIFNSFGANSHALADFYAHTNWVDSSGYTTSVVNGKTVYDFARGGLVKNYKITDPVTGETKKVCGWVPPGLSKSAMWDESSDIGMLFSGTAHSTHEIKWSSEVYTHSHWHKDAEGARGGKQQYLLPKGDVDTGRLNSFASNGMYTWTAEAYDPSEPPQDNNRPLVYGTEWYGDDLKPLAALRAGDRIYKRSRITNRFDMAFHLAIEHTKLEIAKLFAAAAGKNIIINRSPTERKSLEEVFKMHHGQLDHFGIDYLQLYDKSNGPVRRF